MTSETDRVVDKRLSIRLSLFALLVFTVLLASPPVWSQLAPGSMDVHWNEGSRDCAKDPQPPLQQHQYNPRTYILRENLCTTFEAPFMYLLIGSTKALLIDTGDIADPNVIPLAETVMRLLPGEEPQNYLCLSFIPIGTSIIAPVMNSSRNFPMFRSSVLISTAFGATTTSSIGQTASRKSISVIERST